MMKFLETTTNKVSFEDISLFNFENTYISKYNELTEVINNNFLLITAVDSAVDDYLKKALESQNAHFEFICEVCLLYPESTQTFIEYIRDIPECAFFCCKEKPSEENMRKITSGYVEEFGSIAKKIDTLKWIPVDMKALNSFMYVSQGDCNLVIALKNND